MLLAASLLICNAIVWVAAEAYFRVRYDVVNSSSPTDWLEYHPELGWRLRPGKYSYFDVGAFNRAEIFINQLGIRNQQLGASVPTGKRRVRVLRDFFVFTAALSEEQKLTDRLQELAGPDIDVVNVSAPNYGRAAGSTAPGTGQTGIDIGSIVMLVFFYQRRGRQCGL